MTAFSERSRRDDLRDPEGVAVGAGAFGLGALVSVARERAIVRLASSAVTRMVTGERALAAHLAAGGTVYGMTTGLGARMTEPLVDGAASGAEILRGRAVAVGPPLPTDVVRAAMTVRIAGLATGASGASPVVAERLCDLLNAGVHPIVPEVGSLGASDLCLLAHVGLVLLGEGEAEYGGRQLPGGEALRAAGLPGLVPAVRDGLAICSSSAVSVGAAALALADARIVLQAAQVAAALSYEAFRANPAPLDPRVVASRPAPGQMWAADGLRALLAGGELNEPGGARRLQDPLSFRAVAAVHGALVTALERLDAAVLPELGAAADSPAVIGDDVVSTANFHGPALSQALDGAALAFAQAGDAAAARVGRLAAARFSGLPEGLADGPHASGVAPLEKPARALALELSRLAAPSSLSTASAADGAEDVVTGALPGGLRLSESVTAMARLIAVELTVAAVALELRGPLRLGRGTGAALAWVRAHAGGRDVDASIGAGLETMAHAILSGALDAREFGVGSSD